MRSRLRTVLLHGLLIVSLAAGCGSDGDGGSEGVLVDDDGTLTVMTYNVYVGGSLEPLLQQLEGLQLSQLDDLARTAYGIYDQMVNRSDFPGRAQGIADAIAEFEPHFVGLQEMALIRAGTADFFLNLQLNAGTVVLDFRQQLEAALVQRGLDYVFAYEVRNADVELPMLDPDGILMDGRLTVYDVLLVRGDVVVADDDAANYAAAYTPAPGLPFVIERGYVRVDGLVAGRIYRVVNTHLEAATARIRNTQAEELVAYLAAGRDDAPVVLLGDFNSPPDAGPGMDTNDGRAYLTVTEDGFVDMWKGAPGTGYTCCQHPELRNAGNLSKRIDFIFVRNSPAPEAASIDTAADDAVTVGDLPSDRVTAVDGALLWPSDHAAVAAVLYVY